MLFDDLKPIYETAVQDLVPNLNEAAGQVAMSTIAINGDGPTEIGDDFTVDLEFPIVKLAISTSGRGQFEHILLIEKSLAGNMFSWMLGEDPPEEVTDEHVEAVKEFAAQIMGQLQAAYDGEETAFTGGDTTATVFASQEESELPTEGLIAQYTFTRGDEETTFRVIHILTGEMAAAEEPVVKDDQKDDEGVLDDMSDLLGGDELPTDDDSEGPDLAGLFDADEDPGPVEASPASFQGFPQDAGGNGQSRKIDMLLDVELDVTVELGRKVMAVEEILRLGKGSVVELNKLAGEPVDILVNGKKLAEGEVVVVEDHFGVRLTHLLDPQERIRSLGK